MMEIASVLLMLAVLLVLAYIGSKVFAKLGIPGLIGEIVVGIIIANLVIGDWSFLGMLDVRMGANPSENYGILKLFAELGVIFLLFMIGLETKVGELLSVGKAAMLVACLGVLVPFVFTFAFVETVDGWNMQHALFMAAAMVATSVGVTARVIKDMELIGTKEARIIIGAAVIDDVLGMIVLAMVIGMAGSGSFSPIGTLIITIEAVIFVLAIIAAAKWVVPRIDSYIRKTREHKKPIHISTLLVALVVCFMFAWISETIGLAAIIGAFLGGMLLADRAHEWDLERKMEHISTLFMPFFFLNVGMQIDLSACASMRIVWLALVILILAVASKYIGCGIGAKLGGKGISWQSAKIVGVGMIPRGEVGLIVAAMGLASGALTMELYTVIVIMAIATTIIAPPLLSRAFFKKYPLGQPEQ